MTLTYQYELFIYHAKADTAWVEGFLLQELGLAHERVITPNRFMPGVAEMVAFEQAVEQSRYILLILTPDALARDFARTTREMAATRSETEDRDRIIPLILRPCVPPPYISRLDFQLDCRDELAWPYEIARLRDYLNLPEPEPELVPCPYPGMVPYVEQDAAYFFGRDSDLKNVRTILERGFGVLLTGPSGSGKSSFVVAGLLPALDSSWLIRHMRPGATPWQSLEQLIEHSVAEPEQAIADLLAQHPHATRLLLIVDQVEELFTQISDAERAAFITVLRSLNRVKRCQLMLIIRDDFLGGEGERLYFSNLRPYPLLPLRGAELRQAIEEPAALLQVYFESGLVDWIMSDAEADDNLGVLPLMQELMKQLWPRMHRRLVPLSAYEELSQGGRTGLATAIEFSASRTLESLSESQRQIAIRIFLRLVQFTEGRKDTRRRQHVAALRSANEDSGQFEQTMQSLVSGRLLVSQIDARDTIPTIDLAHEELLRSWPQLTIWVEEFRSAEQRRRAFEQKAVEWNRLARNGAWLDTPQLSDAQKWLSDPLAAIVGYSTDLVALVAESQTLARKAARQRRGVIGLVIMLLLSVVSVVAWSQWQDSLNRQTIQENEQRIVAEQQTAAALRNEQQQLSEVAQARLATKLVAQSQSLSGQQPDLALLLGMAAYRLSSTADAPENILNIMKQNAHLEGFLRGHTGRITSLSFSPDGKQVASSSEDWTVKLWDVSGRAVLPYTPFTGHLLNVAFHPTDAWLAAINDGGIHIRWVHLPSNAEREPPYISHSVVMHNLAFSKDGRYLAAGGCGKEESAGRCLQGGVSLFDPSQAILAELEPPLIGHTNVVNSISISPDNQMLASASEDGTIILWDIPSRKPIGSPLAGQHGPINSVMFSPDGTLLASGAQDGTIILWQVSSRQPVASLIGHTDSVQSVAFSPDGSLLVSGGRDKTLLLWNALTGQRLGAPLIGHQGSVNSVVFSPDGTRVASGDDKGVIVLWSMAYPKFLTWNKTTQQLLVDSVKNDIEGVRISPEGKGIARIMGSAISPDGSAIAMGLCRYSTNGTVCRATSIQYWDLLRNQPLDLAREANFDESPGLVFSPDGTLLASMDHGSRGDREIQLWNTSQRELLGAMLLDDNSTITSIQFRNYGKQLISSHCTEYKQQNSFSACATVEIRIWDVATRQLIGQPMQGPQGFFSRMAFNPDGTILAVAECSPATDCEQTEIRLWSVAKQTFSASPLVIVPAYVHDLAFSSDGKTLATATSHNGAWQIKLWDVAARQQLGQIDTQDKGFTSIAFTADGLALIGVTNRFASESQVVLWQVGLDDTSWKERACQIAGRDLEVAEWESFVGATIPYDPPCTVAR